MSQTEWRAKGTDNLRYIGIVFFMMLLVHWRQIICTRDWLGDKLHTQSIKEFVEDSWVRLMRGRSAQVSLNAVLNLRSFFLIGSTLIRDKYSTGGPNVIGLHASLSNLFFLRGTPKFANGSYILDFLIWLTLLRTLRWSVQLKGLML